MTSSVTNDITDSPMDAPGLVLPISLGVIGVLVVIIAVLVIVVIRVLSKRSEPQHEEDNTKGLRSYDEFITTSAQPEARQTQADVQDDMVGHYYNTIEEDGATIPTHPQPGSIAMSYINYRERQSGSPDRSNAVHEYATRIV